MALENFDKIEILLNYDQKRSKIKNGLFMSMIIFFKSGFGLGLLSNQMYYFQTGYILSIIITFIISFIITYSMTLINDISYAIEMSKPGLILENYEEITPYVYKSKPIVTLMYFSKCFPYNIKKSEQDF
jgi:hypothetical protein